MHLFVKNEFYSVRKPQKLFIYSTTKSNAGFTLIEVMVVTLMIGILSAIVAPSWLGFVNRQRINTANEAVFRALQEARQEARKQKISYRVSFRNEGEIPQIAVHSANDTATVWKPLTENLNKPKQVVLGTNLVDDSKAGTALTYPTTTPQTITFDFKGNLSRTADLGAKGLIVTVAVPNSNNSTQPQAGTQRCVIVKTLLGAMQTGSESQNPNSCNPS